MLKGNQFFLNQTFKLTFYLLFIFHRNNALLNLQAMNRPLLPQNDNKSQMQSNLAGQMPQMAHLNNFMKKPYDLQSASK